VRAAPVGAPRGLASSSGFAGPTRRGRDGGPCLASVRGAPPRCRGRGAFGSGNPERRHELNPGLVETGSQAGSRAAAGSTRNESSSRRYCLSVTVSRQELEVARELAPAESRGSRRADRGRAGPGRSAAAVSGKSGATAPERLDGGVVGRGPARPLAHRRAGARARGRRASARRRRFGPPIVSPRRASKRSAPPSRSSGAFSAKSVITTEDTPRSESIAQRRRPTFYWTTCRARASKTRRVKILNANWIAGPDGDDGRFEVMLVTEDDQPHVMAPKPCIDGRPHRSDADRHRPDVGSLRSHADCRQRTSARCLGRRVPSPRRVTMAWCTRGKRHEVAWVPRA